MEDFAASEKFRKYLVEIKVADQTYYTVWGTDMSTDEQVDKVLLHDRKMVIISSLEGVADKITLYSDVFNDTDNIKQWLAAEKLDRCYTDYDLDMLSKFNAYDIENREQALELLNTINLLQDFFYQIDEQKMPLFYQEVSDLKDYIYDNYFWMGDEMEEKFAFTHQVKADLEQSYQLMIEQYLHIV